MSPRKLAGSTASTALSSFWLLFGARLNEARVARHWSAGRLAQAARISRSLVYLALSGQPVSLEAALRMVGALGLKLEWDLVDPRRRPDRPLRLQDPVHS